MKRAIYFQRTFWLLLGCLLIACGEEAPTAAPTTPPEAPTDVPTSEPAVTEPEETPTPTLMPTPTVRPTFTPTPLPPEVIVEYQIIETDGQLFIDAITSPQNGWVAVYPSSPTQLDPEDVLGFTPIPSGTSTDVVIDVDPFNLPTDLQVILHGGRDTVDGNFAGTMDNMLLITDLTVDTPETLPYITISDQLILEDGFVIVDELRSKGPGWITIYNSEDSEQIQMLGFAPVDKGLNFEVAVPIRWREALPELTAYLLTDNGQTELFEMDVDTAALAYDSPVAADFVVTLPPDIVIFNQPVIDGTFVVERVVSEGDGWLVVYEDRDEDGQPGFIIGSEFVFDGINEYVTVFVDPGAVSGQLLVTLHDDTGSLNVFDFPANDPRRSYKNQAFFTTFRTDAGSFIVAEDTVPNENDIIEIPLIVAETAVWVVIFAEEDGQPSETIVGRVWLPASVTENVVIELDMEVATDTVYVTLLQDAGTQQQFEPTTTDFPLQRGQLIVPFSIRP